MMRRLVVLILLILSVQIATNLFSLRAVDARELEFEAYSMISAGMTDADVLGRTGEPDKKINWPPQRGRDTYQYIWLGDGSRDEWTTVITFSSNTSKVINVSRHRK
jgi:hypothetical protein